MWQLTIIQLVGKISKELRLLIQGCIITPIKLNRTPYLHLLMFPLSMRDRWWLHKWFLQTSWQACHRCKLSSATEARTALTRPTIQWWLRMITPCRPHALTSLLCHFNAEWQTNLHLLKSDKDSSERWSEMCELSTLVANAQTHEKRDRNFERAREDKLISSLFELDRLYEVHASQADHLGSSRETCMTI